MATSDKLFVIKTQNRIVGVQEFRMEDYLNSIARSVEELDATDLVQNRIGAVVCHIMGNDRRKRITAKSKNSAF